MIDLESTCLYVNIHDAHGCAFQSPEICCSVSVKGFENTISILPNPVVDELHISCEGLFSAQLLNEKGQMIDSKQGVGSISIDMTTWHRGIYILRIENSEGAFSVQKVVRL